MAYAASAIAPITGRFRRRVLRDLVGSIALGTGIAYYWWYNSHVPTMQESCAPYYLRLLYAPELWNSKEQRGNKYKDYDHKVREEMLKEHGAWAIGPGQQEKVDQQRGVPAPDQTVA
ncbi:uncharacterized protein SPPG_08171 [Spizellomyces punctatus DAOM BR117]|uniref:Uncharacterized protein n=1 Tax=Spizellomyces punctatus (strain DAOM BR117) TaxID=645134 RepID=A0A0L0H5W6_SPIPD|nr:uncharacterized protein SPPG_08171 [Spizellomyces punctatus DAOM BR117]KNC96587.1 hypothetical protein SPPG_08171 [Spizellomyces punctatus DAOM BR117]|eukprot:XP_016604627.1 hypothetical protein SPPG_08171 [Spizellomyces punctatus DAOM BR117]